MVFEVKKTTELSDDEKFQINDLFNRVFDKHRDIKEFLNQFLNNPLGYAYHSLMKKNGVVVGHNAGIPSFYTVDGKRKLFFNNVDTMIDQDCRGIDNFFDLIMNSTDRYKQDGAAVFYGFPNDNSYPLYVPMGLMQDVGKLDTYCLPYRIGCLKSSLSFLNPVSILFSNIWLALCSLFASDKVARFKIEKEAESYNATRYKRGTGNYSMVNLDNCSFVYKTLDYEGIRAAFLIDVNPKSAHNFVKAVKYIKNHDSKNFDVILYVGHLPFGLNGLIRIPRKLEPKHFNFTALILNEESPDTIFDINNWDVNLSNYDLI